MTEKQESISMLYKMKYWRKRLSMIAWRIELIENCNPEDFDDADRQGETEWNEEMQTATIRLISPKHLDEPNPRKALEKILVHEMLHLKMSLLDEADHESVRSRVCHRIICDLADALVR